jgi:hypothetical protein
VAVVDQAIEEGFGNDGVGEEGVPVGGARSEVRIMDPVPL